MPHISFRMIKGGLHELYQHCSSDTHQIVIFYLCEFTISLFYKASTSSPPFPAIVNAPNRENWLTNRTRQLTLNIVYRAGDSSSVIRQDLRKSWSRFSSRKWTRPRRSNSMSRHQSYKTPFHRLWRSGQGRLSTVDLLVLTSLHQLLLMLKILFTFFTKQPTLIRRSTVLSLPPQLVFLFPALAHEILVYT